MSKYIYWVKKKDLFGCFRIEEIRDKDNETGLKEGGVIEMSTTVLPYTRCIALFRYEYLPLGLFSFIVKFIGINTGARLDCMMLTMTVPSTDCP